MTHAATSWQCSLIPPWHPGPGGQRQSPFSCETASRSYADPRGTRIYSATTWPASQGTSARPRGPNACLGLRFQACHCKGRDVRADHDRERDVQANHESRLGMCRSCASCAVRGPACRPKRILLREEKGGEHSESLLRAAVSARGWGRGVTHGKSECSERMRRASCESPWPFPNTADLYTSRL